MNWSQLSDNDINEALNCIEFLLGLEIDGGATLNSIEGSLLQEEDMRIEDLVAMDKDLKGQPINPPTEEEIEDMHELEMERQREEERDDTKLN